MIICDGILSDEIYRPDMSEEVKLSKIGFVIGHEITHGFDNLGSMYGKDGSLVVTEDNPYGWFTETDHNAFYEKVQKVVDYFNNIWPVPQNSCIGEIESGEAADDLVKRNT